jgi:hypothetical protein
MPCDAIAASQPPSVDGHDVTCNPWSQRRALLEGIWQGWGRACLAECSTTVRCSSTRSWTTGWRGLSRSAATASTGRVSAVG